MTICSRRDVLAGLTASGLASALGAFEEQGQAPASNDNPSPSGDLRYQNTEALQLYFAENAPKLLRPAAGILKHPSIAPSLPGKEYATQLWD